MSSCFEYLTRSRYCPAEGGFADPRACTTCDDAGCPDSRASDDLRRRTLR